MRRRGRLGVLRRVGRRSRACRGRGRIEMHPEKIVRFRQAFLGILVRENRRPATDCRDNIKSLAMVLAAVESAKSGKKVPVRW